MGITANIQARLVAIERTMQYNAEAVNSASYIPEKIQAFQLPLFINFPQPGRRVQFAETFYLITRVWNILLIGKALGDGGRAEDELLMYDLIDEVYDTFLSRPRLELNSLPLTDVISGTLLGDDGAVIQPYPTGADENASYYVVEFQMEITYRSNCY